MILVLLVIACSFLMTDTARALGPDQWIEYAPIDGPGMGKRVVLVSGDEEYRSEEGLPQLGKILSQRHGFSCRVVFAIDPDTGVINPENQRNIPGLEALDEADLMIIATRFRDLPDEQMAYIDQYVRSGRPIIGLRTATHAFDLKSSATYRKYTWNYDGDDYKQGFGRQVLGETWIAHHGHHGHESTRGVIAPGARAHPITRGIKDGDIWGPTDVYLVRLPLPEGCQPIILGQVLAGMNPNDDPVVGEKNDPMIPVGWVRTRTGEDGTVGRVFTTTMGAATDLARKGTRRMIVNAVYWTLGLEDSIPDGGADVRIIGEYNPTPFGFGKYKRGVFPQDHALPLTEPDDDSSARFPSDPE